MYPTINQFREVIQHGYGRTYRHKFTTPCGVSGWIVYDPIYPYKYVIVQGHRIFLGWTLRETAINYLVWMFGTAEQNSKYSSARGWINENGSYSLCLASQKL